MDETKKALLSIEIDTAALNQNIASAKTAIVDLTAQLKEMKSAGKDGSEAFSKISELLKTTIESVDKGKAAFKEYAKTLSESSKGVNELKQNLGSLSVEHEKLSNQQQNTNKQTTDGTNAITQLQQKLNDGKASVSGMNAEFRDLLTQQINLTAQQRANGLVLGELRGKQEILMKQIKQAKTTNQEYTDSLVKLTSGQLKANAEIGNAAPVVSSYSKSLKDYSGDLLKSAESTLPMAKSIGDAAKEFNVFKEITGQVGDGLTSYKNKVLATLEQSKTFNDGAGAGAKALEVLKVSSQVATGGFEGLGKAIEGSGVGLFIVVLASAIEYFKKFTPLVEFCQRTTAGLNGAFNALTNIVGQLLQPLMRVFTEPKQALIDFGQFLLHNLINRFTALGTIIDGIIHLDFKKMGNGVVQLTTGVTNGIEKMQGFGKAIGKAYTQTSKLTGAQQNLDRQLQASGLKHAEDAAKIAELRIKAQSGDLASRKKALKEIEDIGKAETASHKKQIEEQLNITTGKIAAAHNLGTAEIGDISTLTSAKIESLRVSKNLNEEEVKSLQEALKKMAELRKEEADKMLQPSAAVQPHPKKGRSPKTQSEVPGRGPELSANQRNEVGQNQTPTLGNNFADITANKSLEFKKKEEENATKFTKKTIKEELALIDEKTKSYQNHFTKLAGMFAKNTQISKAAFLAQKAFAVAKIAINTEEQVSESILATKKAISEDSGQPFPLNVVLVARDIATGIIDVASLIQNGVKQTAALNSVNPQGFARGGLYLSDGYGAYLNGPGHSTSDSINAKLSNGESVINARSTEMFAPILSAINQAGGGRAFNTTNPGNGYALGGLFNGSNSLNDGYSDLANARALNDMAKTLATNMPRQILVVEDVQASLQNKAMLQAMSNF